MDAANPGAGGVPSGAFHSLEDEKEPDSCARTIAFSGGKENGSSDVQGERTGERMKVLHAYGSQMWLVWLDELTFFLRWLG